MSIFPVLHVKIDSDVYSVYTISSKQKCVLVTLPPGESWDALHPEN